MTALLEFVVKGVSSNITPDNAVSLTLESDAGERIGLVIQPRDYSYHARDHLISMRGPLIDLADACGIDVLEDSEQLHDKPFRLFVRRFREKDGIRFASAWGCQSMAGTR